MNLLPAAIAASSLLFFGYGALCLSSLKMDSEFKRFGLEHLKKLTGVLQVAAALGLLVGLTSKPALWISAGGLTLLMLIALGIRLRNGDSLVKCIPAIAMASLNAYILVQSFR